MKRTFSLLAALFVPAMLLAQKPVAQNFPGSSYIKPAEPDEPAGISIENLTKMTCWMDATGWMVSQTTARPAPDKK